MVSSPNQSRTWQVTAAQISANAITPDQLAPYVHAVSGLKTGVSESCMFHHAAGEAVLVAYPVNDPLDESTMNAAVASMLEIPGLERLTVISAKRPRAAPQDAEEKRDQYWTLRLPAAKPCAKLANMLKRADREIQISMKSGAGAWSPGHEAMVENFCRRKAGSLDEGSIFLFGKMAAYLAQVPDAALFSARTPDGRLAACAIGDFTAFGTAFYMFAFRSQSAPPGTADLLLASLIKEAEKRGHSLLNLGLGIDGGIEFFKKKWGAKPCLPCIETSWKIKKKRKNFFSRLFGA